MRELRRITLAIALPALLTSSLSHAQNVHAQKAPGYADLQRMEVPVVPGDVGDHPYLVVSELEVSIKKVTRFSKDPTEERLARKLWEEAKRIGASAVLNARYLQTEQTGLTWGQRKATGQAVRFLTPEEAARYGAEK